MIFNPTPLQGSYEIELNLSEDSRGRFGRFFCKNEFDEIGHSKEWVQMNHSFTKTKGTVRGMHFQLPPHSEIKLVKCISGVVFDVIIDLRKSSPTFLQSFGTELSAKKKNMLYIPEGFAHGFQTITENCELIYLHSEYYQPKAEAGIRFDDPLIDLKWPITISELSEKDKNHPYLNQSFKGI